MQAFLTHLATALAVSPATQSQAAAALTFLYEAVLERQIDLPAAVRNPAQPKRLPAFLTRQEVSALLGELNGTHLLVAKVLYGSGARLGETLRTRIKDVDPDRGELIIPVRAFAVINEARSSDVLISTRRRCSVQ